MTVSLRLPARLPARLGLAALALTAAGCGADPADADRPDATAPGSAATSSTPGPVSVSDGTGTEIALDAPATSVACLDAVCLDALRELDVTPVASTQEPMFSDEAFYGPDSGITVIGGSFFEPDLEGIVAAQPDLVIGAASVHGELREALGSPPLYLQALEGDGDAVENLRAVAELTGREAEAEAAVTRYEGTLAAYAGERDVPVLSMYGGATDDIGIDAADSAIGRTLAAATAYPWPEAGEGEGGFLEINLDQVLEVDPAWIWVLDFGFDPDAPSLVEQLADEPVWGSLQAVQDGHVEIAPSWWGGTNGTRTQQLVLDTVMPAVYPEEFPAPLGPLADAR